MGGTASADHRKSKDSVNEQSPTHLERKNFQTEQHKLLCQDCKENRRETKARTLCFECHKLLCESCSNVHLSKDGLKSHNLIELIPFIKSTSIYQQLSSSAATSTSVTEYEEASDFVENVTFSENAVSFRGAQVAVDYDLASDFLENISITDETILYYGAQVSLESNSSLASHQVDCKRLQATYEHEFSLSSDVDTEEVLVSGLVCLQDTIVIIDTKNYQLKLFDLSGVYISSHELNVHTTGITSVLDDSFATCGLDNKITMWNVDKQTIKNSGTSSFVDHEVDSIHYNGLYYVALHRHVNALSILDMRGKQVRKFILRTAFKKKINFEPGICMDKEKNNIFVPCSDEDGVICISIEGKALWFTTLPSPWGLTEIHDIICVASWRTNCLYLISKKGTILRKLLEDYLDGRPRHVFYGNVNNLYISFSHQGNKNDQVSVYKLHY